MIRRILHSSSYFLPFQDSTECTYTNLEYSCHLCRNRNLGSGKHVEPQGRLKVWVSSGWHMTKQRVRNCFGNYFFPFWAFFGSAFLPDFLASCSILELEAAISTVAISWSWKLSFSIDFATFWWNLQHFGAGSCRFKGICSMFEFEPLIFDGICNILVLELFM